MVDGPIPRTYSSSDELAVFRLRGCRGGFFAVRPRVVQSIKTSERKQIAGAAFQRHRILL